MSTTTREQIFADEEELPSSKEDVTDDTEEGGAFVELPKSPGLSEDKNDDGAGDDPSGGSADGNDQPNAGGGSDVDGLPVPAEAVDYQPSRSGLFGGADSHDKNAEGSVDDQSAAFQEANLTITPTADDHGHSDQTAKRNESSQSALNQRPEVTEISEHHFDNADSAGKDGENESASNDDDHHEEAFIKLAAPSADGADPLSSAIDGGKASDDDDGSVDAMVIPVPGIKRASASGSSDASSDGSAAAKKSRGKRGADGGARGSGSHRNDSAAGGAGGAGDEDDYTPNPNEVFDRTGSKVLVQREPSAREKRGFGQISLSAELEDQSFVDALDMPPTKQIGTPVQGAASPATVQASASTVSVPPSPNLTSGPVKRGSRSATHSDLGAPATPIDHRRPGDDTKSFSVKRSRQDFKPAVGSESGGAASSSCEVLEGEGDKRCKRTASPRVEEADPAEDGPFDVIITLGGGLTSEGEPLPWVVARLRDGNIKFDSEDVFHLLLSRGTTHKAPPKDRFGFEIEESTAMTKYLHSHGIDAGRIIKDIWSLDTIGNAYFARCMVCEPRGFRRVLVVTSEFHMPRAESIFRHVFTVDSLGKFELRFHATPNEGLTAAQLKAREEKEAESLEMWEVNKERLESLADLSAFVFTEHNAYNARGRLASLDGNDSLGSPMVVKGSRKGEGGGGSAAKNLLDTY